MVNNSFSDGNLVGSGSKGIKVRARGVILERAAFGARGVPEMRPADSTAR